MRVNRASFTASANAYLCWLSLLCAATFASLMAGQQSASIVVHAGQPLGLVNPLVFGQNLEAADNAHIFTSDTTDLTLIQQAGGFWDPTAHAPNDFVLNASKAAGSSMLRYPGGCLVHNFDWRKTIGPAAKKNGWLFGLDEYLALTAATHATPLITVSDYVLPAEDMPAHAAALVEYLNAPANNAHPWAMKRKQWGHAEPYHVTWFELGNESMHGNHRVPPHRQYSAEQYAAYANATASAMRRVDPSIRIGIITVPGPGADAESDWNRTVVHLAGKSADFLILHLYAPQQLTADMPVATRMAAMMVAPLHAEQHLAEYHALLRRELGHDLPLAITEFNGALDEAEDRYRPSFANALEAADLLRVFLQPQSNVALANFWSFLNGPFGMVRTTAYPQNKANVVGPAIAIYDLWTHHFGQTLLATEVRSPTMGFPGAGSENAASGAAPQLGRQLMRLDFAHPNAGVLTAWPDQPDLVIAHHGADYALNLKSFARSAYPRLALLPRPSGARLGEAVAFTADFEARFTPDSGSDVSPIGIGLMDARGWAATHSGSGIDGVSAEWKHFTGTYSLTPQTSAVEVTARLMAGSKPISGLLEVRGLVIRAAVPSRDAAYPLLTAAASLSTDKQHVYLIVINKSAADAIPSVIRLAGFSASAGRYWEVNGPDLTSSHGVGLTHDGDAFPVEQQGDVTHLFPAHSMTAIEFSRDSAATHLR